MKIILDDDLQELLLLCPLLHSWESLAMSMNNSASNEKLTLDIVTNEIRNE